MKISYVLMGGIDWIKKYVAHGDTTVKTMTVFDDTIARFEDRCPDILKSYREKEW